MVDTNKTKVFVYGSLKRTHALNILLQKHNGKFLGYDRIQEKCELLNMGAFPAVVFWNNVPYSYVYGETWELSPEGLAALDFAEGTPSLFDRRKITTDYGGYKAWIYTINPDLAETANDVIEDGFWVPTPDEERFWNFERK